MVTDMDNLTREQKEFIVGLKEIGISEKVTALLLFLIPGEGEQRMIARYIVQKAEEGSEITDSVILEYLMDLMKEG